MDVCGGTGWSVLEFYFFRLVSSNVSLCFLSKKCSCSYSGVVPRPGEEWSTIFLSAISLPFDYLFFDYLSFDHSPEKRSMQYDGIGSADACGSHSPILDRCCQPLRGPFSPSRIWV
jgi:hypothetical protein